MTRINLISGPRNISTALMYSFAQRSDTIVFDEPYYAVYLKISGADHPGREEILKTLQNTEAEVNKAIDEGARKAPVVFIKNMAHHIEVLSDIPAQDVVNVFLIRDPGRIIASYSKVIERPVMRDLGIAFQHDLFEKMKRSRKRHPVVVDSHFLLANPAVVLKKLCDACGIAFDEGMLNWPAGPKPYDGCWAPYWYDAAHRSTGFTRPEQSDPVIPEALQPLLNEASLYYQKLLPYALTPEL